MPSGNANEPGVLSQATTTFDAFPTPLVEPGKALSPNLVDSPQPSLSMLLEAMEQNRLELYFQPVMNLLSRRAEWYEGLLRLRTREGEILPPSRFIPLAEREPEVMTALDLHVLKMGVHHLLAGDVPRLSVNVSGVSFSDPDFSKILERVCGPLPASIRALLILEITETAMIRDLDAAKLNCRTARLLGLELAMDDFGEAFSSMMILRELPFTIMKIHGSFAANLQVSQKCWLITDWMRRLGFELGMNCVLEFISSEQLCQEAIKMDFLLGQGFHLGNPLSLNELRLRLAAEALEARELAQRAHL